MALELRFREYDSKLNPFWKTFIPSACLMIPRMLYRGIMLYYCWLWFIVPIFKIAMLPLISAVCIGGMVSMLTFEDIGQIDNTQLALIRLGQWAIGASAFFVAIYLIHLFVQ